MNKNINSLYQIASKPCRTILGLMSGTSMDGLDMALCRAEGSGTNTRLEVLNFKTVPFSADFRTKIREIFSRRDADLQSVCLMNEEVALLHAKLINQAFEEWKVKNHEVDLIASHGQTIFHAPASLHKLKDRPNATLQIGDGDHIAVNTGIITLSDFRQKHIAAGGEGAPLAVYGDYLLFSKRNESRILLNIGGIANFTSLPGDTDPGKVFSTDVGPGNTIMDQYCREHFDCFYDEGGKIASRGSVNNRLLTQLLSDPFFDAGFPKTTGPELFSMQYLQEAQRSSQTETLDKQDVVATLCHFTANAISSAIKKATGSQQATVYLSGGGMHNSLLVNLLKEGTTNADFKTTRELGIDPDAKEAVLFAILANEAVAGSPINFGSREGIPAVTMGKVSFP